MKWQAVTDAFDKARALPPGSRQEFLREHCAGDDELRRETESLLKAYEESGDFLEDLAIDHEPGAMPPTAAPGDRLGPYRILRCIGEGGMGEVYEAERADGEFRQRVAIKVVRHDGLSERGHDRFRAERQILSDLSHPHIARLFDGGTTESGAPYLVMELIDGLPIDGYCDSRNLSTAARLELFAQVCDAVDYANRQQVIHCDLKPANILVTAGGVPKLLDFGISRLGVSRPATAHTQTRAATPEYASPEQLSGEKITPAADVYSLGVILRRIAPDLTRIISRATDPQPGRRYPSAAALADAARQQARGTWSRRRLLFTSTGAVAALAAGGAAWWRYRGLALGKDDALAIMRIENRTGDRELDWADRGIADLLATNFAQAGGFEVISTSRSRELLERTASDQRKAAGLAHAGYYVTGDLLRLGPGLRLNLRVEQTASGRIHFAQTFDGASPQALVALADQASSAILAHLRASEGSAPSGGRALSADPRALRLYEEGCAFFDRWQVPKAVESFRRAIEIDPQFAMAYYRLALCDPWHPPSALRDLDRASDLATRLQLPAGQRHLIDATRLGIAGRLQECAVILGEAIRLSPRDAELRVTLGASFAAQGDFNAALSLCKEALDIDPNSRYALMEAGYAAGMVGRVADALAYADRYAATLEPGDWNGADVRGDVLSITERFDEAASTYAKVRRFSKMALAAMHGGDFNRAEAGLKTIVDRNGAPLGMGGALSFLGDVQVGRGNLEAARPWFERSVRTYADYPWYGGLVLWKAAQVALEQSRPDVVLELAESLTFHPWSRGVRAVALAVRGRSTEAEAELDAFRTAVGAILGPYMGERWQEVYRIFAAFYRGDHAAVVSLSSQAPRVLWHIYALPAGRSNLAQGNLERAGTHLAYNRTTQLCWAGPGQYEAHNFFAFVLGEFYLGQLAARRGHHEEARKKFAFFLKHFAHSTAKLPQIVEAAS